MLRFAQHDGTLKGAKTRSLLSESMSFKEVLDFNEVKI